MSLWVDGFLSGWVGELMSSGVAGHLCIGKPLSWLVLYSARFVETLKVKATSLKVKATSLYNTRARERWARSLLLSFSAAPFCLIPHVVSPYPQSHLFTFSSFHLFTFSPPPLTTANTLVLRTLTHRKPIFMQQMRWCFMPLPLYSSAIYPKQPLKNKHTKQPS